MVSAGTNLSSRRVSHQREIRRNAASHENLRHRGEDRRGNRKLQRYRKKLRLQGLDENTINKRMTYVSSNMKVQSDNYDNVMECMVSLNDKVC